MTPEPVDRFRAELDALPTPILVHCASGKRAAAFTIMHVAIDQGMSGEEILKKAEEIGFECDQKELRDFVKSDVDCQKV